MLSLFRMQKILNQLLQGQYSFKRKILFPEIYFEGVANFSIGKKDQRVYTEKGRYNKTVLFQQKLIFRFCSSNLRIYKSDYSLLHQFFIDESLVTPVNICHTHHCVRDQYFLNMTIYSEDSFSTSYRINGPFKNYTIHTDFSRVV